MSQISEFPLTGNVLLRFKSNLRKQQSELRRAIDRTHKEIRALAESGPGDVIDDSCGDSFKEAMFATYSQSRAQLRRVEAALERIATGDFGICAECGGAIGLKRLQALPWAHNCIECQEQSERGSRLSHPPCIPPTHCQVNEELFPPQAATEQAGLV